MKQKLRWALTCYLCVALASPAFAWGNFGHQTVARIAARHLTPKAKAAIVTLIRNAPENSVIPGLHRNEGPDLLKILGTTGMPSDAKIEEAMAVIATWPDHMPSGKQETSGWHFVDIGLFEGPAIKPERCPQGSCVAQKITEMENNIRSNKSIARPHPGMNPPAFTPDLELRFLVHFVGDIHQPLHAATNADGGGNCLLSANLDSEVHAVWDTALVTIASKSSTDFAGDVIKKFNARRGSFQQVIDPARIAAESFNIAKTVIYPNAVSADEQHVPVIDHFVDAHPGHCEVAPPQIANLTIDSEESFDDAKTLNIVRLQLYKGGVRLAQILNLMFP